MSARPSLANVARDAWTVRSDRYDPDVPGPRCGLQDGHEVLEALTGRRQHPPAADLPLGADRPGTRARRRPPTGFAPRGGPGLQHRPTRLGRWRRPAAAPDPVASTHQTSRTHREAVGRLDLGPGQRCGDRRRPSAQRAPRQSSAAAGQGPVLVPGAAHHHAFDLALDRQRAGRSRTDTVGQRQPERRPRPKVGSADDTGSSRRVEASTKAHHLQGQ
jgi:hypothetical protein